MLVGAFAIVLSGCTLFSSEQDTEVDSNIAENVINEVINDKFEDDYNTISNFMSDVDKYTATLISKTAEGLQSNVIMKYQKPDTFEMESEGVEGIFNMIMTTDAVYIKSNELGGDWIKMSNDDSAEIREEQFDPEDIAESLSDFKTNYTFKGVETCGEKMCRVYRAEINNEITEISINEENGYLYSIYSTLNDGLELTYYIDYESDVNIEIPQNAMDFDSLMMY